MTLDGDLVALPRNSGGALDQFRRCEVDDRGSAALAPVADQFDLRLANHRRLQVTALDDKRRALQLGQQASAGGTSDFLGFARHGPDDVRLDVAGGRQTVVFLSLVLATDRRHGSSPCPQPLRIRPACGR